MTHYQYVFHFEYVDGVLHDREAIQVRVSDYVGDISVNKYFAWLKAATGVAEEEVEPPEEIRDVRGLVHWLKTRDEKWEEVLKTSGVPEDSFLTMRTYDDAITYQLAGAASEVLGAPVEACL